ncbi:MAG: helix-turn-helix domain-containing protein [bacterium]|nr:helix-turn-helix domain-containing protein [bacterium]
MSKKRTTRASLADDGTVTEYRADGASEVVAGRTDWQRVAALTDEEVRHAAQEDSDAPPLTIRQLARAYKVPERIDVRAIRLKRNMSQAAFAARYGLALDALQDWEQGRRPPNRYARILLAVIDKEPRAVERALTG